MGDTFLKIFGGTSLKNTCFFISWVVPLSRTYASQIVIGDTSFKNAKYFEYLSAIVSWCNHMTKAVLYDCIPLMTENKNGDCHRHQELIAHAAHVGQPMPCSGY